MGTALPALFFGSVTARRRTLEAYCADTGKAANWYQRFAGIAVQAHPLRSCRAQSALLPGAAFLGPIKRRSRFLPGRLFPRAGPLARRGSFCVGSQARL